MKLILLELFFLHNFQAVDLVKHGLYVSPIVPLDKLCCEGPALHEASLAMHRERCGFYSQRLSEMPACDRLLLIHIADFIRQQIPH